MRRKKVSFAALLLVIALLFTGCSQKLMDQLTEAVVEHAKEETANQSQTVESQGDTPEVADIPAGGSAAANMSASTTPYAYSVLNHTTKQVYDEVYTAMMNFEDSVELSTADQDILQQAYYAVMADHGGIFWVDGYSYTEYTKNATVVRLEFHPNYTMDESQKQSYQKQVDMKVNEILSGIRAGATDYEKAKYVYETLASTVTYQTGSQNNQNILSVFINGVSVCQGYACATQYLLSSLGVTCVTVSGTAAGSPHAWNLVCLDGNYYYMDTTWGSGSYNAAEGGKGGYVDNTYLAVTSQELFKTHAPNNEYPLPVCDSMEDNYFVQEGLYFTQWDTAAIGEGIKSQTPGTVSLKFATDELYDQAISYYIDQGKLWDYYSSNASVYYIEHPEMRVLMILSEE